ncbi:hypothetical protein ACF0H5_024072 [Mactra antiquata]
MDLLIYGFCATALVSFVTTKGVHDVIIKDPSPDGVQEIMLPMCRNFLPYNMTKLPNQFGHLTQVEVYRHIEHQWAYMDYGCSNNFRLFVCALYLPKYEAENKPTIGPCKETCNRARSRCKGPMKQTKSRWPKKFKCGKLPSRKGKEECLRPIRENKRQNAHVYCSENDIPVCRKFNTFGSLPNFFMQRNIREITTEMRFYDNLIASGCNEHLAFFLCGTYMPFCVHNITPFSNPCRELCEQVKTDCSSHFAYIYRGLPWPNKLQCHRYVNSTNTQRHCSMPGDDDF